MIYPEGKIFTETNKLINQKKLNIQDTKTIKESIKTGFDKANEEMQNCTKERKQNTDFLEEMKNLMMK